MVIKTAVKPKGPSLPSKKPGQLIYNLAKEGLKVSGLYDEYNLQRYDPDVLYEKHISKYLYKPRKRLTGYVFQTKGFLRSKKKTFGKSTWIDSRQYEKLRGLRSRLNSYNYNNSYRRSSRLSNISGCCRC